MAYPIQSYNFIINAYNNRLMSTNDFDAVYWKHQITSVQFIRLLYTAGMPVPGDKMIAEIIKHTNYIIVRIK